MKGQRGVYILFFVAILNSLASAQNDFEVSVASGLPCDNLRSEQPGWVYDIVGSPYFFRQCCLESVQSTISSKAQCESFCETNGWPWLYGYLKDNTYQTCTCLTGCWDHGKRDLILVFRFYFLILFFFSHQLLSSGLSTVFQWISTHRYR